MSKIALRLVIGMALILWACLGESWLALGIILTLQLFGAEALTWLVTNR